jgi:archaellum component FlaC
MINKKSTKGRYTSELKEKVEGLKEKIKLMVNEYTDVYQYQIKPEKKFKEQ